MGQKDLHSSSCFAGLPLRAWGPGPYQANAKIYKESKVTLPRQEGVEEEGKAGGLIPRDYRAPTFDATLKKPCA